MIPRDTIFKIKRDNGLHIVSEHYGYKTEPYYTILDYESRWDNIFPKSKDIIDASVVPICLERARLEGVTVCKWGISQEYAPSPSIVYGMNYFSNTSDYSIIGEDSKKIINHITNYGKYPFCYQVVERNSEIETVVSIFGESVDKDRDVAAIAKKIYNIFRIPLVTLVFVRSGDECLLSSISQAKYSKLSKGERSLLKSHLEKQ